MLIGRDRYGDQGAGPRIHTHPAAGPTFTAHALGFTLPPEWVEWAACANTDPETWFPDKGNANRAAKRICYGCPVCDQCLDYALQHDERWGIWGGMSERERRALKREMRASA